MQAVKGFHLFSKCIRFHVTQLAYSIWMPVQKLCYGDIRYMWVVWQVCMVCWHFPGRECMHTYSDDTLSFSSWDHGSAHIVCFDRRRRVTAMRRNLQMMHRCCGASTKLMGILGSTFRTSWVWCQKACYSNKLILLVWFCYTGLFVCAISWPIGLRFNALIHAHHPDLIEFQALQPSHHSENLNNAFDFPNNDFGIPRLLDAEGW